MDAYLEEELYDIITYCIQNPNASDFEPKKHRIQEIGKELYADGGVDAMENIFYPIEFRIKGFKGIRLLTLSENIFPKRMALST